MAVKSNLMIILLIILNIGNMYAQDEVLWDDIFTSYIPENVKYDTLEGTFLYETIITSYIAGGDAIVKGGDFVKFGGDSTSFNNIYKEGLFTCFLSDIYYERFAESIDNFHYDTAAISKLFNEVSYMAIKEDSYWKEMDFNPYCGSFYKKYHMKFEVVYLGMVKQRIPLLMNCKEAKKYMRKNKGKNFQEYNVPTYLITNVFECVKL